jgi:hypothetical protein
MTTRARLLLVSLACLAGLIIAAWGLGVRIRAFHAERPRNIFAFQPVDLREFRYAGRPVTLVDDLTNPQTPYLVVSFGEETLRLRVTVPGNYDLPGLLAHTDWLRIVRFAPLTGLDAAEFEARIESGEITDRLAIVTRTPRAGANPESWGAVWKRDWEFDFYELLPDGTIAHERLGWPTYRAGQQPKPGELRENTWQYQAALQVMPGAGRDGPMYKFSDDAMSRAGWTMPLGAVSGIGLILSLAFAFAPKRTERAA